MKNLLFLSLGLSLSLTLAQGFSADYLDRNDPLEPLDTIDEEDFEELFEVPEADTIEEEEAREEALMEHEAQIRETNMEFLAGKSSWYAGLDQYSNLPDDELEATRTGSLQHDDQRFFTGLLKRSMDVVDERSERYFNEVRMSREAVPDSYNAIDEGLVTPVKNQKNCGSCVAFATMAAAETCFKKRTGKFADYSEQQFVDCGYDRKTAWACRGAYLNAYMVYGGSRQLIPSSETQYPYLNNKPLKKCPAEVAEYNIGAKMEEGYDTWRGDEELLKKLIYKHGAVIVAVKVTSPFYSYRGGVYKGCGPNDKSTNHAVTAVGYGTENGEDYWLIKNSWGESWGQNGYIKIQRGVEMCGIGPEITVVECSDAETGGATTTAAPKDTCKDKSKKCPQLAETSCYKSRVKKNCQKSCGQCEGMTEHPSAKCYNKSKKCDTWAETQCYKKSMKKRCKKACGLCEGMEPVPSNTCYDQSKDCADKCDTAKGQAKCKKTCGLC